MYWEITLKTLVKLFSYLENHQDEILPLSERDLPFDRLCSLGYMDSNIGKAIALRMKTRGCSWSRSGAQANDNLFYAV